MQVFLLRIWNLDQTDWLFVFILLFDVLKIRHICSYYRYAFVQHRVSLHRLKEV